MSDKGYWCSVHKSCDCSGNSLECDYKGYKLKDQQEITKPKIKIEPRSQRNRWLITVDAVSVIVYMDEWFVAWKIRRAVERLVKAYYQMEALKMAYNHE